MNETPSALRILHLEDNNHDAELIRRRLADHGITPEFTRVMKRESYLSALEEGSFDLILSDYTMPGFDGVTALGLARQRCPRTPFIFVSGTLGESAAIENLKKGAANCVSKDRLERLAPAIREALQESEERRRLDKAEEALEERAELFRQISENVTDLVSVLDLDGRRLYTSHSYQALLGSETPQITDAFADVHPEDRDRIRELFRETVKTGIGQRAEFRLLLKDGSVRHLESHGGVIRDRNGGVSNVIVISRDVTKRRRAEQHLKASEERFRSVVQTANDAIILTDSGGNIAAWNSAAQRMFGYAEEEVRGKPLAWLFSERYREGQQASFNLTPVASASRFIAIAVELRGLRKDGTEFPLELSLSTWRNESETCYSAILRDISARERTRQTLEHLRRQNELVLNAAGEGICGVDREGRITFANPAAAKMLACRAEDLLGSTWPQAVRPPEAGRPSTFASNSPIFATLNSGLVQRIAGEEFWKKDGTRFYADYVSTPLREKGECTGAVIVFKDITERNQVAEQLREQAALLESATDAICVIDMEARIIFWNKGAERMYGWPVSEAVGKIAHELLFKEETQRPSQAFRALIKNRQWQGELRQVTRTGREVIVESRWTLMHDTQGAPKSILVINSDITEKKALEAQILRAQRLDSVGRLAGGIAHDLNNVLSPILMTVPLLGGKLQDEADRKILGMVEGCARRGADMVRQILSFSRGVDGTEGPVQIKHIINEQVKVARHTFPPTIDIRSRISTDLRPVLGNATQLFQVLMNLCVNARDAMPKGGTLLLEAENVLLDTEYAHLHPEVKAGPHVVMTVSDTGSGIRPELLEKIFQSFFTTKKQGAGTGLGLSTVMTIVKNHHGHVRVTSDLGKGTTFKIYLPTAERDCSAGNGERTLELPQGHGEWILVVDDEETIREITTATLEHSGYRVLAASDGTEAVARYAKYKDKIRLVITDLVMPFMDGDTLMRALRRMNSSLKILAMSGRMENHELDRLKQKGGIVFLPKPFSSATLLTNVHQLLAKACVPS